MTCERMTNIVKEIQSRGYEIVSISLYEDTGVILVDTGHEYVCWSVNPSKPTFYSGFYDKDLHKVYDNYLERSRRILSSLTVVR
jgi:hypothetical protein